VIAGGGPTTVLLSAGFAAAITESIPWVVGYTSPLSQRDSYQGDLDLLGGDRHDHERSRTEPGITWPSSPAPAGAQCSCRYSTRAAGGVTWPAD
jgi:hypothetical protein